VSHITNPDTSVTQTDVRLNNPAMSPIPVVFTHALTADLMLSGPDGTVLATVTGAVTVPCE
jgi:hypothetical protein